MHSVLDASQEVQQHVAALAAQMSLDVDQLGHDLARHCREQVPELGDDEEMREATDANGIAHVGAMASLLRFGIPADGVVAPAEALGFARMAVHRGVGLPTLLRCYHVGQVKLWHQLADGVFARVEDPAVLKDVVMWSTDFVSCYLDAIREHAVLAYGEEHERWQRSITAMRERAIRRVLAGELDDPEQASLQLRYDLQRHHVAFVISGEDVDPVSLERAAADIAGKLGGGPALSLMSITGTLWAWTSSFVPFEQPGAVVVAPSGMAVALGTPGHGIAGFRASHDQARRAARIQRLTGRACASYADAAFLDALTAEPAAARMFAAQELGRLAAIEHQTLRDTLLAYLQTGASHKRAALQLGVHEKTVVGRVRRAEELLGVPVAGRRAAVEAALQVGLLLP